MSQHVEHTPIFIADFDVKVRAQFGEFALNSQNLKFGILDTSSQEIPFDYSGEWAIGQTSPLPQQDEN